VMRIVLIKVFTLYRAEQHIPCFVAVFDVDRILVWWSALGHVSGFTRYRPSELYSGQDGPEQEQEQEQVPADDEQ
jgi:hypothetical protein